MEFVDVDQAIKVTIVKKKYVLMIVVDMVPV